MSVLKIEAKVPYFGADLRVGVYVLQARESKTEGVNIDRGLL